jgi:hypothetical protein
MEERYGIYSPARDWGPEQYSRLLDLAAHFGGSFVVVSRAALSTEGDRLLRSLGPFAVYVKRGPAWPGTRLLGGAMAGIYKFSSTEESLNVLRRAGRSVWDWLGPQYPEDLSFLRPSGTPWFVSITHEHDAFFKLVETELAAVKAIFGEPLILQCEDQCPEETY